MSYQGEFSEGRVCHLGTLGRVAMKGHEGCSGKVSEDWDQVVPLRVGPLARVSSSFGSDSCVLPTVVTCLV